MVEIYGMFLRTSSVLVACVYTAHTWSWSWDYDIILNLDQQGLTRLNVSTSSKYIDEVLNMVWTYGFGRTILTIEE